MVLHVCLHVLQALFAAVHSHVLASCSMMGDCPHIAAQKITDKCFAKCVTRPGPKLDDSEKRCMAMCMDRYLDSMAIVSQAVC